MGIKITVQTILEADKQYALYKKDKRGLPERTTFMGSPFPTDQEILDIVLSKAPVTDYSGVDHVELDLDLPSGLCTINEDDSCSIDFKE